MTVTHRPVFRPVSVADVVTAFLTPTRCTTLAVRHTQAEPSVPSPTPSA
jgi:hypothetical protein